MPAGKGRHRTSFMPHGWPMRRRKAAGYGQPQDSSAKPTRPTSRQVGATRRSGRPGPGQGAVDHAWAGERQLPVLDVKDDPRRDHLRQQLAAGDRVGRDGDPGGVGRLVALDGGLDDSSGAFYELRDQVGEGR